MFIFKNKVLTILVNTLLVIWQLPQCILGILILLIFRKCELYTNEYNHITVLNINKGNILGSACFSAGPIICTTNNCAEVTKRHETGHSKQSVYLGPLFLLIIAVPSVCLFWYRRLKNKSHDWYLSCWPESSAEKLGGTAELKNK